jgi:hypothetical protein
MRRLFALTLVAACALVGGSAGGSTGKAAAQAPPPSSDRLFVQNASSGALIRNADGTMTVKLVGVPSTLWFNDRPARASGVEETATFVQGWTGAGTFAKKPPNAVLEGRVNGVRRVLPVELTGASYAPDTATVQYTERPLPRAPGFYRGRDSAPKLGNGTFGSSSLFIDDASSPAGCWVQFTIPNIVNQGVQTWAGLQINSGGTFSYVYGPEVQSAGDGILYSFIAAGGNIGSTGPEQWFVQPRQQYFQGSGMVGGTVQFIAWFQPEPGSLSVVGSVLGNGSPPTANAPTFPSGACSKVDMNTSGAFTISFGVNS